MPDQAAQLRTTAPPPAWPALPALAVTGGKGGVGKTSVAVNLTLLLARAGLKPLLVDLDLGLANADVMLGASPAATLLEAVTGAASLPEVVADSGHGFPFVPAASGHEALTRLTEAQFQRIFAGLGLLARSHDLLVLDTPAGIGREVMLACRCARCVLLVVNPEPTSLTDAYALLKLLEQSSPGKDVRVLVNMADHQQQGMEAFARLRKVALAHLRRDVELLGIVPRDRAVPDAVRRRRPLTAAGSELGPAATALRGAAQKLKGLDWKRTEP